MDPLFKPGLDVIAQSSIKSLLAQINSDKRPSFASLRPTTRQRLHVRRRPPARTLARNRGPVQRLP